MKVAIVWSSPNTDGLTASAKNSFLNGLQKADAGAEEIHLNNLKLDHCRACRNGWDACRALHFEG